MTALSKILHIEDDPEILQITGMALELIGGFEILQVESGERALETIETFDPQLVLSDVQMPGLSGPETLSEMRKLSGYENVPAVYLTARLMNGEEDLLTHPKDLGVVGKPFDPTTLASELQNIWQSRTSDPNP